MFKWTLLNRNKKIFRWGFSFNETVGPELASPLGGHHSKPLKIDMLTRGLSFSGLSCERWREILFCPTLVRQDFLWFPLIVRIRALGLIRGKGRGVLKQAKELFCLRELSVSSNPRSEPETAWQILVDTSLHWVDTGVSDRTVLRRLPAEGGWWHWHWHTTNNWCAFLKTPLVISS